MLKVVLIRRLPRYVGNGMNGESLRSWKAAVEVESFGLLSVEYLGSC